MNSGNRIASLPLSMSIASALVVASACTMTGQIGGESGTAPEAGQAPRAMLIDVDDDGVWDGADVDGDGHPDVGYDPACGRHLLGGADGVWDGIDFDCDRKIDAETCERPLVRSGQSGFANGIDVNLCDGVAEISILTGPSSCWPAPIDVDQDGYFEGYDLDCDASVDLWGVPPNPNCWPEPVDDDGDGNIDGLDADCDGNADRTLSPPSRPDCWPTAVDLDQDGDPDGVDFDCDGQIDGNTSGYGGSPNGSCWAAIDTDGDGFPNGLDLDCDGTADW
jgi:hypothetical protein